MSKKRFLLGLLIVGVVLFAFTGVAWASTYTGIMKAFKLIDNGCWFCGIYRTLLGAMDTLAYTVSHNMSTVFKDILKLLLFGYLLWKVGKAVVAFSPINPVEFVSDLVMPMLRAILVIILLSDGVMTTFFEQVVSPVAELAIGFATTVREKALSETPTLQIIKASVAEAPTIEPGCVSETIGSAKVISASFQNAILCFIKTISLSLINFMGVGATFITDCWGRGKWGLPSGTMLGIGLCFFIGAFMLFISFPFKLLDSIIRLMFVLALMPLWVVLWVLPATRDKSKAALEEFLGVLINFIAFSIIYVMVIQILMHTLDGLKDQQKFFSYLVADHSTEAMDMIDWGKTSFWMTIAMFFLANALLGKAESFGQTFGGKGSMGVGASTGKLLGGYAQKVGVATVKPIATRTANYVGKNVGFLWDNTGGRAITGLKNGAKAATAKTFYGSARLAGRAVGAAKRGFSNMADNVAASGFNTSTGVTPQRPTQSNSNPSPTPPNQPKPKVEKTTKTEKLPDGKTKETTKLTHKDAQGRRTHDEKIETIKDKNGKTESKTVTRSEFDAKTQDLKQTIRSVESKFNEATGKFEQKTITVEDGIGRLKAKLEKTEKGKKKTVYDDKGNVKTVTEKTPEGTTQTEYEKGHKVATTKKTDSGTQRVEHDALGRDKKIITKDESTGKTTIQENTFSVTGKPNGYVKTELNQDGRKTWMEKDDASSTTRTEFDAQEREAVITTTNKATKDVTRTENIYGANGRRSGFTTKVTNKSGNDIEHYTVNLTTNKKIDYMNGNKETDYKP